MRKKKQEKELCLVVTVRVPKTCKDVDAYIDKKIREYFGVDECHQQ